MSCEGVNELKHPEGVQGNQPGVKPRSGATPGVGSKPLHPSRDAWSCEITLPVVTLASLANHRLISVHPFGVSLRLQEKWPVNSFVVQSPRRGRAKRRRSTNLIHTSPTSAD